MSKISFTVEDENGREVKVYTNDEFDIANYLNKKDGGTVEKFIGFDAGAYTRVPGTNGADQWVHQIKCGSSTIGGFGVDRSGRFIIHTGAGWILASGIYGTHNFDPNTKLNTTGGTITGSLTVHGVIHSNGNVTAFSDRRLKTNITDIESEEIDKFYKLEPKKYVRNERPEFGLIAQDLKEYFPDMVFETDQFIKGDTNPILSVCYQELIPLLISIVKQQNERITKLEKLVGGLYGNS